MKKASALSFEDFDQYDIIISAFSLYLNPDDEFLNAAQIAEKLGRSSGSVHGQIKSIIRQLTTAVSAQHVGERDGTMRMNWRSERLFNFTYSGKRQFEKVKIPNEKGAES